MQRLHKFTWPAAVVLLVAGGLILKVSAQPAPEPVPQHLAVINIVKVFAGLDQKNAGDREIEDLHGDMMKERKKKEDALQALAEGLKEGGLYKPGSPEYKKQQDDYMQANMDLQVFLAVSEQRLLALQRLKTEEVYDSMNAAIKKYAEAHGIAIVFVTDDADLSSSKDINVLQSRIAMRKIIYAHPSYDITNNIIVQMNTDYHPAAH